jgi:predicted Zn-dependent protease
MRRTRRLTFSPYLSALAAAFLLAAPARTDAHGDVHEAIITLTKELESKPDSIKLLFERASLYSQYEHWPEALADLDRLKTLEPAGELEPALRASVLRRSGTPAEARALQEAFLKTHPRHSQVRWDYCQTLADLKETKAALQELDSFMAAAEHPAPDAIALRLRLAEAADPVGALTWLDGFLATHPLPVFQEEAVRLEIKLGRQAAAVKRMDQMIAAAPRPEFLLLRKADLLKSSGDEAGAATAARSAQQAIARLPAHIRSTRACAELERKAANILTPSR